MNGERSARKALRVQCLADTNLKCVFVADEGFIKSRNLEGFSSLIWCVDAGGIIAIRRFPFGPLPLSLQVLGTSSISSEKKKGGGLPWKMGDYRLSLDDCCNQSSDLSTIMKAIYLMDVRVKMYATHLQVTKDPRVQSLVFPPSTLDLHMCL